MKLKVVSLDIEQDTVYIGKAEVEGLKAEAEHPTFDAGVSVSRVHHASHVLAAQKTRYLNPPLEANAIEPSIASLLAVIVEFASMMSAHTTRFKEIKNKVHFAENQEQRNSKSHIRSHPRGAGPRVDPQTGLLDLRLL